MSFGQERLDEALAAAFGAHLGGMFHGVIHDLRKHGYWVRIPEPDQRTAARYLMAASDPMGLDELRWSTACLSLRTEPFPYDVVLELGVYGARPPYIGGPFVGIERRCAWKGQAIQDMLHAVDPKELLGRLLAGLAVKTPPPSPKHWIPGRKAAAP